MNETPEFNPISFWCGVISGMIIRSTDILPMFGGFLLGLSVKKLPNFLNFHFLPKILQDYYTKFKNNLEKTK